MRLASLSFSQTTLENPGLAPELGTVVIWAKLEAGPPEVGRGYAPYPGITESP